MQSYADRTAPVLDNAEYPGRWTDYIGQVQPKRVLQTAAKSARMRRKRLNHTLITGPPGVGKTALVAQVARELGKPVRVLSGVLDSTTARLIFMSMRDGDVVFYDEAHTMMLGGKAKSEWWLNFLQDGAIPGPLGLEEMPDITVIAATSEAHKLSQPIRDRFLIRVQLERYAIEEAAQIVAVTTRRILGEENLPAVTGKDAAAIARAAGCNPRIIKRHIATLLDVTMTGEVPMKSAKRYDVPALLDYLDVTEDGLTRDHREYLRVLCDEFGGKAGFVALTQRIRASEALDLLEGPLLDAGLIAKTSGGRIVTGAGIMRNNALQTEEVAA